VVALSETQGFPFWLGLGRALHAAAHVDNGDAGALADIIPALAILGARGAQAALPAMLKIPAEAQRAAGQLGEAKGTIAKALAIAAETGQPYFDAERHQLDGDVLLALGRPGDDAAARYQLALGVAREEGQRAAAHDLLARSTRRSPKASRRATCETQRRCSTLCSRPSLGRMAATPTSRARTRKPAVRGRPSVALTTALRHRESSRVRARTGGKRAVVGAALGIVVGFAGPGLAHTVCDLRYDLDGWSIFYKEAAGHGTVRCDNGQRADVRLETRGGGITFGRSRIVDGHGTFSPINEIDEIFGDYANAEAHAGIGVSSGAHVVTKGPVSLTLSGTGTGVDLGFAFGRFTIVRGGGRDRDASDDERREYREAHEYREEREQRIEEEPVRDPAPLEDGY
jgi:hypothetical protein